MYSEIASQFLAKKITLVSRTGCPPERWNYDLTITLEKFRTGPGKQARLILLMEADFNMYNKIIFGKRMMDAARTERIIPKKKLQ